MVKLIASASGKLLGGHIIGHGAESMISEIALALRNGVSLTQLASVLRPYPTWPEAIRQAAEGHVRSRLTGTLAAVVRRLVRR